MKKLYTCTDLQKIIGCSGKTIRHWAEILFEREYPCWLFTEEQIEILKEKIQHRPGRPGKTRSIRLQN